MTQARKLPTPLVAVAYWFLLLGIMSAVEMLIQGTYRLDFSILGIFIFFGLRRCSPGWRTCALVFIWLGMIGLASAVLYTLFGSGPKYLEISGHRYTDISAICFLTVYGAFFTLNFWMYRVLTRPDIRILFYAESPVPAA